jgi:tripartite-type tricarboxylate transporter receptor subunit TctC
LQAEQGVIKHQAQVHMSVGRSFAAGVALARIPGAPDYRITTEQNMKFHQVILGLAFLATSMGVALPSHAQDYPNKLIKIVVPFAPGGGTDVVARLVAERLQAKWGQAVIVEHRPGAGGNIGAEAVFRAPPDGYTLLLTPPPPLVINKSLYAKLSFDPDELVPVSLLSASPNVLLVHPKLPIKSTQQLIDFAKANPDRLNYASQGNGTTSHLTAELFKSTAGIRLTHVPYKGSGPAITDLMGGQVEIMFAEISTAVSHIQAGTLRALAVGSEKRNHSLPNIPTVSETLPGFMSMTSSNVVAPPKTPPAIVNKLSSALAEVMRDPAVVKRLSELSAVAIGSTPAEHAKFLAQERKRWGGVIRVTGTVLD